MWNAVFISTSAAPETTINGCINAWHVLNGCHRLKFNAILDIDFLSELYTQHIPNANDLVVARFLNCKELK